MFLYYNANPLGNQVNDCTVRAISLATGQTWDNTYKELSTFAQAQGMMLDEVRYIDEYLDRKFEKVYGWNETGKMTVGDFIGQHPNGIYLITMAGHITCGIDGCIYDTFDPRQRIVWAAYKVRKDRRK